MELELINRTYQSLNKGIRYHTTHGNRDTSIVIEQRQSGKIYLDYKSAKILLAELKLLIDEAEEIERKAGKFNINEYPPAH